MITGALQFRSNIVVRFQRQPKRISQRQEYALVHPSHWRTPFMSYAGARQKLVDQRCDMITYVPDLYGANGGVRGLTKQDEWVEIRCRPPEWFIPNDVVSAVKVVKGHRLSEPYNAATDPENVL